MFNLIVLLSYITLKISCSNFTDIMYQNNGTYFYSQPISGINNYVNVQFSVISNPNFTYSVVLVSFINYNNLPSISSFYGVNPDDTDSIDLEGLWMGRKQYISRRIPGNATQIYISIFNLDQRPYTYNFRLTVNSNQVAPICPSCYPPSFQSIGRCQCQNCDQNYEGYDCTRYITYLQRQTTKSEIINQIFSLKFYKIPKSDNTIRLTIGGTGNQIQVYVTFVDFKSQIASYVNVETATNGQARFPLSSANSSTSMTLSPKGRQISITIGKYTNGNSRVQIYYQQISGSNILVIVLAVLGSLVGVGLIIGGQVIVYIIFNLKTIYKQVLIDQQINKSKNIFHNLLINHYNHNSNHKLLQQQQINNHYYNKIVQYAYVLQQNINKQDQLIVNIIFIHHVYQTGLKSKEIVHTVDKIVLEIIQ